MTDTWETGQRLALFCTECRTRVFGDPEWRCPNHPNKTVIQRNASYMGQEVPTPKVGKLKILDTAKIRRGRRA